MILSLLIFTLPHVFDIKLRDSTGQVKVHKIKIKMRKMERRQEMSPCKTHVLSPTSSPHPTLKAKL